MKEQGKQVKEVFRQNGVCIAEWAREKGFPANLVYDILSGRKRCLRGKSHQIAVELGIKSIT
ncbi:MAG: hypothetical protein C0442_10840 [Chlorobiaceae bacterium]|nr:hypothetical protein [Chlorobiaceae bacterium]